MIDQNRIAIWAGVSSIPQAELDSIDDQIAAGRLFVESRNGEEVAVLEVPGATRDWANLPEATAGLDALLPPGASNAFRQLLDLIESRSIDVLWVRALDRLGRSDPLIAEIQYRCRRAGITVYSQAMPPTGQETGDLFISAIERAGAERELIELKRRTRSGMDGRLRRGLPLKGRVPFPYVEDWRPAQQGARRMVRHFVPDPECADGYRWAVNATLERTHTKEEIAAQLHDRFPEYKWREATLLNTLRSPVPVGLVVRHRLRLPHESSLLVVYEPLKTPLWSDIEAWLLADAARWYHSQNKVKRGKITIATRGVHDAVIEPSTWLELQRFLDLRAESKGPPSRLFILSGILRCGRCGDPMHVRHRSGGQPGAYMCRNRRYKSYGIECDGPQVSERKIKRLLLAWLTDYLEAWNEQPDAAGQERYRATISNLEKQRQAIMNRQDRNALLFETGRRSLGWFDEREATLVTELAAVEQQIRHAQESAVSAEKRKAQLASLAGTLPRLGEWMETGDPVEVNRILRNLLRAVYLDGPKIVRVELM